MFAKTKSMQPLQKEHKKNVQILWSTVTPKLRQRFSHKNLTAQNNRVLSFHHDFPYFSYVSKVEHCLQRHTQKASEGAKVSSQSCDGTNQLYGECRRHGKSKSRANSEYLRKTSFGFALRFFYFRV